MGEHERRAKHQKSVPVLIRYHKTVLWCGHLILEVLAGGAAIVLFEPVLHKMYGA
jgi:hypothetical protein